MNLLTKVLMTAALLVIGYFLFIGLFYVVAAGALLIAGLYGFSLVQKYWHRIFGGPEPDPATFTFKVQRGRVIDPEDRGMGEKTSPKVRVIDVT